MSRLELVDEPLAPLEEILEIDSDSILKISPPAGSGNFINGVENPAPGEVTAGNWISYVRADGRIEVYLFSRHPVEITPYEEGDSLKSIEVGLKKATKVARAWVKYPDIVKDSDADGIPDYVYKIDLLSNKFAYMHEYITQYTLASSIFQNEFDITEDLFPKIPFAISQGDVAYDGSVNPLQVFDSVHVHGGSVNFVDIKNISTMYLYEMPGDRTGDVILYDVFGAKYKEVTRKNWDFKAGHNLKLGNGLIEATLETGVSKITGKVYSGIGWDDLDICDFGTEKLISGWNIIEKYSDYVKIDLTLSDSTHRTITLKKGSRYIFIDNVQNVYSFENSEFIIYENKIVDTRINSNPISYTPVSSPHVHFIKLGKTTVPFFIVRNKFQYTLTSTEQTINNNEVSVGAISSSYTYVEDSEFNLRRGSSKESDSEAHDGSVVRITQLDGGVSIDEDKSGGLQSGKYSMYIRLKNLDASYLRVAVWYSDGTYDLYNVDISVSNKFKYQKLDIEIPPRKKVNVIYIDCDDSTQGILIDYILILPPPLAVSNFYLEDSDINLLRVGSTRVQDPEASDGSAIRMTYTFGGFYTDKSPPAMPPGKYIVFCRLKNIDSNYIRFSWYPESGVDGRDDIFYSELPKDGKYHIVPWEITVPEDNFIEYIYIRSESSPGGVYFDYLLIVPYEELKKTAEDSFLNVKIQSKEIKEIV